MAFRDSKVYYDGSHYICIPHKEGKRKRKKDAPIPDDTTPPVTEQPLPKVEPIPDELAAMLNPVDTKACKATFKEVYESTRGKSKKERATALFDTLRSNFPDDEQTHAFIKEQLEREHRNTIRRRARMIRKARLQEFNYFATITYNSKKMDEKHFRKYLSQCLAHFAHRNGWKYIGVWERSPKTQRLHFHALLYVPEGTMPGFLYEQKDYSIRLNRVQTTYQSTYFNNRFGRSDFEPLDTDNQKDGAIAYILKYIEKSGEKIVYSRKLPQYFISDIADEDIICPYDDKEQKYVLADNFTCYDYGEIMGKVSKDTIKKMRKSN